MKYLFLLLFLVLPSFKSMAANPTVTGEISKDFSSMSLVVTVVGATTQDSEANVSLADLNKNLFLYFPEKSLLHIRRSSGATSDADTFNDVYYDAANTTPIKKNIDGDKFDLEFSITIYDNKAKTGGDTLQTIASIQKLINVKAVWKVYDTTTKKIEKEKFAGVPTPITVVSAAPDEVPEFTKIEGVNRGLTINWNASSNIKYSDGVSRSVPKLNIILIERSGSQNIDFATESYIPDLTGNGTDAVGGNCTLNPNETNCLTCTETAYLNYTALKAKEAASNGMIRVGSVGGGGGSVTFVDLKPDVNYIALMQYERGLKRSACASGTPILDQTLSDRNGEGSAGTGNPSCFVASVAFGSRIHPYISHLRWFRDAYLVKSDLGKRFVSWYYKNGESLAKIVSQSILLKYVVKILLLPIIGLAFIFRVLGPQNMAIGLFLFIGSWWLLRRLIQDRSHYLKHRI